MAERRGRALRRLRSGQWLGVTAGVLVAAGLVGTLLSLSALGRLRDARETLVDRVDPTRVVAGSMLTGLLDQESAVRGYALSRRGQFLVPYRTGQAREARARARLQATAATGAIPGLGADVMAVERAAADWRTGYGDAVVAAVRGHRAVPSAAAGTARFARVQQAFGALEAHLGAVRARERARLFHAAHTVREAVILTGLMLILAAFVASATLRTVVTVPIARLARDARRVARGNFEHGVAAQGPRDIAELGADVESMRRRIIAELDAVRDARSRLEAQTVELQRSNAELEQFAYVASHDLQEPLRKIASFCGMLQHRYQGQLDERADQYIEFAVDGAKRMQVLINDLLAFSRVGRVGQEHRLLEMDEVADDALRNLAAAIEESHADVRVRRPLPAVRGDRSLLTVLVQNLVANAIKFRGEEPPLVEIAAERDGDEWRFTIADNGIGIAPRHAERIFVIFQRLHTKEAYAGTGIGLAMCRKIVEYHGGRIWLEPGAGEDEEGGARFTFTLPVAKEDA